MNYEVEASHSWLLHSTDIFLEFPLEAKLNHSFPPCLPLSLSLSSHCILHSADSIIVTLDPSVTAQLNINTIILKSYTRPTSLFSRSFFYSLIEILNTPKQFSTFQENFLTEHVLFSQNSLNSRGKFTSLVPKI